MVGAPFVETEFLRRAAIFIFLQDRLAFAAEKIIGQQQSAVRVRRLHGDGGAADIGRHDVHGHPFHRRAFADRVQRVVAKDAGRRQHFT